MATTHPELALAIAVLGVWRLCHLIAHEDGPFDAIARLRERAGDGVFGALMDCAYCLSLWWAVPFAAFLAVDWGVSPLEGAALWLGISGGASLIERATDRPAPLAPHPAESGAPTVPLTLTPTGAWPAGRADEPRT